MTGLTGGVLTACAFRLLSGGSAGADPEVCYIGEACLVVHVCLSVERCLFSLSHHAWGPYYDTYITWHGSLAGQVAFPDAALHVLLHACYGPMLLVSGLARFMT